ncbi:MAG: hypothetical protein ACI8V5_004618, partial [Limisphaerales bacterium]
MDFGGNAAEKGVAPLRIFAFWDWRTREVPKMPGAGAGFRNMQGSRPSLSRADRTKLQQEETEATEDSAL